MSKIESVEHYVRYKMYSNHPQKAQIIFKNLEEARNQVASIKLEGYNAWVVLVVRTETEYLI